MTAIFGTPGDFSGVQVPVDELCSRLEEAGIEVRRSGAGWRALCPLHPDSNPSLSLSEGDDGQALAHCFGCGYDGDTYVRLLEWLDSGAPPVEGPPSRPGKRGHGQEHLGILEAQYDYRDREGRLVAAKFRYEGKQFRWKPHNGSWFQNSGLGDTILPPFYRLPEFLERATRSEYVILVEGEKDVETLWKLGAAVTCPPDGKAWPLTRMLTEEPIDVLVEIGKPVVIIQDRDENGAGQAFAERVFRDVVAAGLPAAIWETPLDQPGADATDHVTAGLRWEDFRVVVDSRIPYRSVPPDPPQSSGSSSGGSGGSSSGGSGGTSHTGSQASTEGDAAWPKLIPLHGTELPPFPTDVLPETWRAFVMQVAAATQTPVDAAAMLSLAAFSAAAAGKADAHGVGSHIEELMLYVAVVMGSGERKTALFRDLVEPLWSAQGQVREGQAEEITKAKAEKEKAGRKYRHLVVVANKENSPTKEQQDQISAAMADRDKIVVPSPASLVLTSATPEALSQVMADNGGKIALLSDEGSIFGVIAGRYSANGHVDLDIFLHGHNAGYVAEARISRRTPEIRHARLIMGLAVQPGALAELAGGYNVEERGLLGRFLYAWPAPMAGGRVYGAAVHSDDQIRNEWIGRVSAMAQRPMTEPPVRIEMTTAAATSYIEFQNRHEKRLGPTGDLEHVPSWAGKHAGQILRIAALFALWRHSARAPLGDCRIDVEDMQAAIKLSPYLIDHALRCLTAIDPPITLRTAERIIRWRHGKPAPDRWTARDAYQYLKGSRGTVQVMETVTDAIDLLELHEYVRRVPTTATRTAGRRASQTWETNPAALGTVPPDPPNGTAGR